MSDDPSVSGHVQLLRDWPKWWSKIELFDGRLAPPVLYFDLDTTIVGPLEALVAAAAAHQLVMLRCVYSENRFGSGIMAWNAPMDGVFRRFASVPETWMRRHSTDGDQGFLRYCMEQGHAPKCKTWQDLLPGACVSYKAAVRGRSAIPDGASVVYHHGKPRPWEVTLP
jgi:hypothetical protein